jgi:photosystem II stability/assembly factor-like uncharacterized protein
MLAAMRLPRFSARLALSVTAASLAALSLASPAHANGRYPAAGLIAIHPSKPDTILVRATYGSLLTKNGGQRWSWICEPAIGYGGFEDPMVSFTADGTILAGIFEGLSISHDLGCQWDFAPGGLSGKYVIDLAVDKVDPTKGVLIISNSAGQDDAGAPVFLTQLWETTDSGKTWAQAGVNLPKEFLGLTVDTAPSDAKRVYVSGRYGPPDYLGAIHRSDDRGATWQKLLIPGSDDVHLPYIAAIDPHDPDIVYVRLDGDPTDQLIVSKDGGMTWNKVYESKGDLLGFALSPDGATVAIGGDKDGLLTSPASSLAFTQASTVGVKCLTWSAAGIYACADEFVDGFTAGVSTDQGKTFTPIMHLAELCGPLECAADTSVGMTCTAAWPATQATIMAKPCDGSGGSGSTSGSGTGGGGSGGGESSGCSCSLPAPEGSEAAAGAVVMLGIAGALARRGRRRPRS